MFVSDNQPFQQLYNSDMWLDSFCLFHLSPYNTVLKVCYPKKANKDYTFEPWLLNYNVGSRNHTQYIYPEGLGVNVMSDWYIYYA